MDEDIEGTPNCPNCLHPLQIAGTDENPYWSCGVCGWAALTT